MRNIKTGQSEIASKNINRLNVNNIHALQDEISKSPQFAIVFASIQRAMVYSEDPSGRPHQMSGDTNLAYAATESVLQEDEGVILNLATTCVVLRSHDHPTELLDNDDASFIEDYFNNPEHVDDDGEEEDEDEDDDLEPENSQEPSA